MRPNIDIIFFDVGSVLIRRRNEPLEVMANYYDIELERVNQAHLSVWSRQEVKDSWHSLRTVEMQVSFAITTAQIFLQELGLPMTEANIRFYERAWNHQDYELMPGALETLSQLAKRYRLGVISNAMPTRRQHEMAELGLLDFFDPIVISAELGIRKPDRRIYEAALELAERPASRSAFVDDRPLNLEAAKEIGFGEIILFDPDDDYLEEPFKRIVMLSQLRTMFMV